MIASEGDKNRMLEENVLLRGEIERLRGEVERLRRELTVIKDNMIKVSEDKTAE